MTIKQATSLINKLGMAAAVLVITGCAQTPGPTSAACLLTDTNNVDRLFADAHDKLSQPSCYSSYPRYREQLISAARGAPGPENEARFAELLRSSIDRGIITQRQGQALFSEYFDAEFYSVKAQSTSSEKLVGGSGAAAMPEGKLL